MGERALALYFRLSKEDKKEAGGGMADESNSIANQRKLLLDYVRKKKDLAECKVVQYIDDGYSGTAFHRPGFCKMMEDVKKGQVQCVLVKDFSRFGRDYIELGDYIEHIFPFMQVRFISVNDGYDSLEYRGRTPEIDVPFRNLAYALYSQDISDKVKSSLAARQKNGFYIGAIPPYGYRRDKEGALEPDEETEAVVRRIFKEYLEGEGLTGLAGKLNREGMLSPKQYKIRKGILKGKEGETYSWTPGTVRQILRNRIYIGEASSGAYKNGPLGSGKRIYVPESGRIRVEDAHMPIIDKEVFHKAQERMGTKNTGKGHDFLLKGLVRCGECGRTMGKEKKRFRCRYQGFTAHEKVGSVLEEGLESVVWEAVRKALWLWEGNGAEESVGGQESRKQENRKNRESGEEQEDREKKEDRKEWENKKDREKKQGCQGAEVSIKEELFRKEKAFYAERRKGLLEEIRQKELQTARKKAEAQQRYQRYKKGEIGKEAYLAQKAKEKGYLAKMESELERLNEDSIKLFKRIERLGENRQAMAEWIGWHEKEEKEELLRYLVENIFVYAGKRVEICLSVAQFAPGAVHSASGSICGAANFGAAAFERPMDAK